jgi:hypothetical protein
MERRRTPTTLSFGTRRTVLRNCRDRSAVGVVGYDLGEIFLDHESLYRGLRRDLLRRT